MKRLILWLVVIAWLLSFSIAQAVELVLSPATPIVEINKTIVLSVQGAIGKVKWIVGDGKIQGEGPQVTYLAPDKAGFDVVAVLDSEGNVTKPLRIVVTLPNNFLPANAQWEVFSNFDDVGDLVPAGDKKSFYASTDGGLVQYDTTSGELKRVFTAADGLPSNAIDSLFSDDNGIWIETVDNGLARLSWNGEITAYHTGNSCLPHSMSLGTWLDGSGGIWTYSWYVKDTDALMSEAWSGGEVPTFVRNALSHLDNKGQWTVYSTDALNTSFSGDLVNDNQGGVWITFSSKEEEKTTYTLYHVPENRGQTVEEGCHLTNTDGWIAYTAESLGLPGEFYTSLSSDEKGGVWIGMQGYVIHFTFTGESKIYSVKDAGLPGESIVAPIGVRADGTFRVLAGEETQNYADRFIFDLSEDGTWAPVPHEAGRPQGIYTIPHFNEQGGYWAITGDRQLWYRNQDEQWSAYPNSSYPYEANPHSSSVSDNNGGFWMGTIGEGLVHLDRTGQWTKNSGSSKTPFKYIQAMSDRVDGEVWILGMISIWRFGYSTVAIIESAEAIGGGEPIVNENIRQERKLARCRTVPQWACHFEEIPEKVALDTAGSLGYQLIADEVGGLWLASWFGLSEIGLFYRNKAGQWTAYNSNNSPLPSDAVTTLVKDGRGGWWIGTEGGLAHFSDDQQWTIYTTDNSQLPENLVFPYAMDDTGGLWIITNSSGLVYLSANQDWQIYTKDNSGLLSNQVFSLSKGSQGSWWVGFAGTRTTFLGYFDGTGNWKSYELNGFPLPLLSDNHGGVWVSTYMEEGLAHFSKDGEPIYFTSDDSALPIGTPRLSSDNQGGIWVQGNQTVARLTFSRQTELCTQAQIDAATCQAIQQGQHAAIIVAAGGAQQSDTLWDSTEAITTRTYRTFYQRGFNKSSIYYLSSKTWADFNGDGFNDNINRITEDRYLTLDDLKTAFEWAKGQGKLDQPLYFFFMDHGGEGRLRLSPNLNLSAEELKAILDDYQNATGNPMIVVIEACHSGSLIPVLSTPNRAVVTSAKADEKAYFFEKKGFTRFFADYLLKGASFSESFALASRDQDKLRGHLTLQTAGDSGLTLLQTPQFDDDQDGHFTISDGEWLKQVYINGKFETADATLTVKNLTTATTLTVGQPIVLQAKAVITQGTIKRVWAVIRPPAIAQVLDTNGTPILAFPRLHLGPSADNPEIWQATWQDAVYNGNYLITFYAEDNEKNIASSEQDTLLTVSGGTDPPAKAQVQIHLEKDRYQRGEPFKATLTEDLGWGYDLYAAIVMPNGDFIALNGINNLRPVNEAKPWYAQRKQGSTITLFDWTLPADLPTGQYCLYGILSPEQNDVFETKDKGLWVYGSQCFEVY